MSRSGRNNVQINQAKDSLNKMEAINSMPPGLSGAFEKLNELEAEDTGKLSENKLSLGVDKRDLPSKSLKSIVLTGKAESIIDVAGHQISLSTLSAKDRRTFVSLIMSIPESEKILALKTYTLSVAIKSIGGKTLEELYDEEFGESNLNINEKRVEFLENMSASFIDVIYDKYNDLVEESNNELSSSRLENKIKN